MIHAASLCIPARARSLSAVVLAAVVLSGCGGGLSGGFERITGVFGRGDAPAPALRAGSYQASAEGVAYLGELRAAGPGIALTSAGAIPVTGHEVWVRGTGLGADQGASAKRGARALCEAAGGRFNDAAIGRHLQGAWVFAGGCA